MPVNVAVEEPRARIIGDEAEGDIVGRKATDTDDISPTKISIICELCRYNHDLPRRVDIVVVFLTGTPYDIEVMAVQVEGMLQKC